MEQLNTFAKEQDGKITINGTPLFAVTDFSTKSLGNNMMNVTVSFDAYVVPPLVVKSSETDAEDWKGRLKAEYAQTKERYEKLKAWNNKQEVSRHTAYKPVCNEDDAKEQVIGEYREELMRRQQGAMGEYLHFMELRASLDGIEF